MIIWLLCKITLLNRIKSPVFSFIYSVEYALKIYILLSAFFNWYCILMLKVHSVESMWAHEGPGLRFVLFLQGCMFKCLYCHNPDTIPSQGGKEMSSEDVLKKVLQSKPYFRGKGGFTVSGGEPMLQAKDLIPLFHLLKKEWIHIAVDTNGFPWNDDVKELIELVDLFLVDIKHINNDWHKKLTGQSNENTFRLIDYLQEKWKHMWIRYVLVSDWTTQPEFIEEIGKKYGSYSMIERLEILPYHKLGVHKWKEMWWEYWLEGAHSTSMEQALSAKELFEKYFEKVVIR